MTIIAIIVLAIIAISAISLCIAKTAPATPASLASVPSVLPISNKNSTSIPIAIAPVSEEKYKTSKIAYNAINIPAYTSPDADTILNKKWQMFSKKDLNKIVNKLSIEKVNWHKTDCFMHGFSYNYADYNENGQWFGVHCHWNDDRRFRSALRCIVDVYYFNDVDEKRERVSLFEHRINITSYRDLRLFIEYALRVKREYMKQTSIA